MVKSAPQAKIFETQNAYFLEWQVFQNSRLASLVVKSMPQTKFLNLKVPVFKNGKFLHNST